MEADFSGYATKVGLKCTDGRTILKDAFKHQDKIRVPLVWQHGHKEPTNVLGHALLENREDGVYAYGFFNDSPSGKDSKVLVQHGDVNALSIYAVRLLEKAKSVVHGTILEVSLVLAGANPGALIDNVNLAHSDGEIETLDDEAIIYTGLALEHEDVKHAEEPEGKTLQDIYDGLAQEEKDLVHYMIGAALEEASSAKHSDEGSEEKSEESEEKSEDKAQEETSEETLTHQEGSAMTRNVFEQNEGGAQAPVRSSLTHDQLQAIFAEAGKTGSLKQAVLSHAVTYGIENIDLLFPDARAVSNAPEFVSRRMEWVNVVLTGTKHSPFSRIKSLSADITLDTARAKGYVKATMKKDEFFALTARETTPQTIYKKQKLDRDDIIDITDLDVVAWLKAEMRVMLDEEIARAVLIGDGRAGGDEDKIIETKVRPIARDAAFYAHPVSIPLATAGDAIVDAIITARPNYRGVGNPTLFTTEAFLTSLLLIKDTQGRKLYPTVAELATTLRVSNIVTVPVMDGTVIGTATLLGVMVNLSDYTIGADKGGAVTLFDDFDIDYNQYKYLLETRISGALTKYKTALVFTKAATTQELEAADEDDEDQN